jgi:hypothetical protein
VSNWNKAFVSISALDISEKFNLKNEDVMALMEDLRE